MSVSARRAGMAVAAALLGGSLALQVVVAPTASAHTRLVSSAPAAGSTVDRLPSTAQLAFSEPVAEPTAVAVIGPDDAIVSIGAVEIDDNTVSQRMGDAAAPGLYTITYRATSRDGHSLDGYVTFTLRGDGAATATTASATGASGTGLHPPSGSVVGLSLGVAAALGLVLLGLHLLRRHA